MRRSPFFPPRKNTRIKIEASPAEAAVIELVAKGWTFADIALKRKVCIRTIQNQITSLKRKKAANTLPELAVKCLREGVFK